MLTDPLRYDTPADVKLRLHNSIVRYKGIPVNVQLYNGSSLVLKAHTLRPNEDPIFHDTIHSSDVELDISSPPLGYMNTPNTSIYVQRIATRKQIQGFYLGSAHWIIDNLEAHYNNSTIQQYLTSEPIANTILNKYPKGINVLEKLLSNPTIKSIAFHSKFSLMKDDINLLKLRHMGRSIGFVKPNTNKLIINKEFNNPIFTKILTQHGFEVPEL